MGGADQAVAAFDAQTGKLAWKGGYFVWAPSSPILIDVDGQRQLVVFGGNLVAGMDPANGRMLWSHPHKTDWGLNISTPVWSPTDRLLFLSSAYGTRKPCAGAESEGRQDHRRRKNGRAIACESISAR